MSRETHPLNGVALLLGDLNGLRTGWQRHVVVNLLAEKLQELVGVVGDQLSKLGVAGTELLENRLQHLGLLLDDLTELLELSVVSEEVQVAEATLGGGSGSCSGGGLGVAGGGATSTTAATTTTTTRLGSKIEEVDVAVITAGGRTTGRLSGRRSSGLSLCLLLLDVFGDALVVVSVQRTKSSRYRNSR